MELVREHVKIGLFIPSQSFFFELNTLIIYLYGVYVYSGDK